jgi:thioredoxin 1
MSAVIEATDATFEQEVLKADKPVLVDFWAPGCPPCAALAPVLEKIAAEMSDQFKFVKVNAAQERTTAAKYRIQAVPTVFIFSSGEVADSAIGFQPDQEIRRRLNAVAAKKPAGNR